MSRRGDNIPSVSDYSHWNEDAQYMWYAENRYDMEHSDEIMDDDEFSMLCDDFDEDE